MSRLANQRGSALLIVLFILLLFTVLGLSIFAYVGQSSRQHVFTEDEIQGKMLADMGLAYFQKYAEHNLAYSHLSEAMKTGSGEQKIKEVLNRVAAEMTESNGQKGPYKKTDLPPLPDGSVQGFAIGYRVLGSEIRLRDNPGQPYVLKLRVSVVGIPARGSDDLSVVKSRVRLDSTVYINTIAAPFHYAVSTPGQLRLFGGANLIGHVAANHVVTSTDYRYSTEDDDPAQPPIWHVGTGDDQKNRPYVEGILSLSHPASQADGLVSGLYRLAAGELDTVTRSDSRISIEDVKEPIIIQSRKDLSPLFSPKTLPEGSQETLLSAPPKRPYEPGYEPPIVQNTQNAANGLRFAGGLTASEYIFEQIGQGKKESSSTESVAWDESLQLEPHTGSHSYLNDGFRTIGSIPAGTDSLAILAEDGSDMLGGSSATVLTARLTGDRLERASVRQLYIAPFSSDQAAMTTVEMGRLGSFIPDADAEERLSGEPFAFTGTIYIKGNLDIVGDIRINGTIFVDGDVLIREIANLYDRNLAIVATGTISLTSRYTRETDPAYHSADSWESLPPLSAFLYSEKSMEIYSVASFNRILGGIATGSAGSYIELNTKRNEDEGLASRFAIQFNRRIFEAETPGLPSAEEIYLDLYDLQYSPHPEEVRIQP